MLKSSLYIAISAALFIPTTYANSETNSLVNNAAKTAIDETDASLEHILVTSDFRQQPLAKLPTSIAVITQQQILDDGGQHFGQLMNRVVNLNYAGGSSRPKYFQIRGVGERSEYRGAPNSSVGFIVDDIDISGLGMAANMFDVQQIEVLRGPQGTRLGANALAGLINIKSNAPTDTFEHGFQSSVGDDALITLSGFSSGPISDKLTYRLVLEQHQQNGYRSNSFLDKEDTNQLDELTGKLKLHYQASEHLAVDFNYLFADLNNGYDVWTLDNNGYDTSTDLPGVDQQESNGSSLKVVYDNFDGFNLTSITSFTQTDHQHAYDGDWANPSYWSNKQCTDYYDENGNDLYDDSIPCQYDYLWSKLADRKTFSQELRLTSNEYGKIFSKTTDWLAGIYYSDLDENNAIDSSYNGWPDEVVDSNYKATNIAAFSQIDSQLAKDLALSIGIRIEYREAEYTDSLADEFSPSESMWGGHVALSKAINENHSLYGRIARGYKAGGFNMGLSQELSQFKEFDTETLNNFELGFKSNFLKSSVIVNLAAFYMDRKDQQVNASVQNPDKPQRFIIYTANAASSSSYGLELDINWQLSESTAFFITYGALHASYNEYAYQDKYGTTIDISDRSLAHAPHYTYSLGGVYKGDNGLFFTMSLSGKSDFYFSDSHSEKAGSSQLLNARIGYEATDWSIYLWGRNLSDERNATRGFYFGNEPDIDWASKKYVRYGAPRHFGVTFDYQF